MAAINNKIMDRFPMLCICSSFSKLYAFYDSNRFLTTDQEFLYTLILIGLKNIDDSAIFCLHRDRIEVFDKISNFHRQFALNILKKSGFSVKGKGGSIRNGFALYDPAPV